VNLNSGFSEENLRNIAAQKVSFRFSVKIHVVIFIIVNVLLSFVNFFFTPDLYWIVFPFYARGVHPMAKRGIIYHVNSFIFVMLFLFIVNFITLSGIYWVVFPAIFWGTGVILHLIIYSMYYGVDIEKSGKRESRKERAIEKELAKMRKKQSKKT
jgi:hypothetical protein